MCSRVIYVEIIFTTAARSAIITQRRHFPDERRTDAAVPAPRGFGDAARRADTALRLLELAALGRSGQRRRCRLGDRSQQHQQQQRDVERGAQ